MTNEFFIGMSWKIFQVSHVSHMSQKKKTELGTTGDPPDERKESRMRAPHRMAPISRREKRTLTRGYAAFPGVAIVGKQCALPPGENPPSCRFST